MTDVPPQPLQPAVVAGIGITTDPTPVPVLLTASPVAEARTRDRMLAIVAIVAVVAAAVIVLVTVVAAGPSRVQALGAVSPLVFAVVTIATLAVGRFSGTSAPVAAVPAPDGSSPGAP